MECLFCVISIQSIILGWTILFSHFILKVLQQDTEAHIVHLNCKSTIHRHVQIVYWTWPWSAQVSTCADTSNCEPPSNVYEGQEGVPTGQRRSATTSASQSHSVLHGWRLLTANCSKKRSKQKHGMTSLAVRDSLPTQYLWSLELRDATFSAISNDYTSAVSVAARFWRFYFL